MYINRTLYVSLIKSKCHNVIGNFKPGPPSYWIFSSFILILILFFSFLSFFLSVSILNERGGPVVVRLSSLKSHKRKSSGKEPIDIDHAP